MDVRVYHSLKILLKKQKLSTGVGDEGGFAPDLKDANEVFKILQEACIQANYKPGKPPDRRPGRWCRSSRSAEWNTKRPPACR